MSCGCDDVILGKVGRSLGIIRATAAGLITSQTDVGDQLANLLTFDCAVLDPGGTGRIDEVIVFEKTGASALKPVMDLVLLSVAQVTPALPGVGAGYVAPATLTEVLEVISITAGDYKEISTGRAVAAQRSVNANIKAASSTKAIYGVLIARANVTFTVGHELTVELRIARD